jgi:hypothetical protein
MGQTVPILEEHLDLAKDPSYVVREVPGRLFPWLVKLSEDWTRANVRSIFPLDKTKHRMVAWQNYIMFCRPYDPVLPLLSDEYSWAISEIGTREARPLGEADRRLSEHLVTFFWQGKLDLGLGGLIDQFYAKASDELGEHALEFIGRSLDGPPEQKIPPAILDRLRALWESRVKAAEDKATSGAELAGFGWWFASKRFDPDWSCQQLLVALRLARKIDPDFSVAKQLVEHVDSRPLPTLEALFQIIEADREGWSIYGWDNEARQILERAIQMNNPQIYESAKRVVDLLFAKGHFEYRHLLKSTHTVGD